MGSKPKGQTGIIFTDADLDMVPLDDEPYGEVVNGHTTTAPSKYNGEPVSCHVIHAPPSRTIPPPKKPRRTVAVGGDKVLLVMTIVAVLVAFIALLIGGLGLARRGDIFVNVSSGSPAGAASSMQGSGTDSSNEIPDDKVWLFAIGDYNSRLEYLDLESGEVKGYNVDVINAVCRIANKNCQLVWDVYDRCWETVAGQSDRAGIGLLGGFYDACTAWAVTYSRARTFKFTDDMSKQHLSVFMVSKMADAAAFNWRNLTGKTIGFLQSYVQNANCLKRYTEIVGGNLDPTRIRYYMTQQELLAAVNNGEVDAVFVNEYLQVTANLQRASEKLDMCSIGGMAMMTRKDGSLDEWWNPAFESLVDSPEYLQICEGLDDANVHGNIPGPTLDQQCIGF